jgi:hypothetical protein
MKFYLITLLTLLGTMANAKADCTYNYVPESFGGWSSVESNYFSRKNINFVSLIQIELAKKNWSFADKSQNSFYLGLTKIRNTRNVFNVFVHGGNDVNLIENQSCNCRFKQYSISIILWASL